MNVSNFNKLISKYSLFVKSVNTFTFPYLCKHDNNDKGVVSLGASISISLLDSLEDKIFLEVIYSVISVKQPIDINIKVMITLELTEKVPDLKKINFQMFLKDNNEIRKDLDEKITFLSNMLNIDLPEPSLILDNNSL